MGTKADATDYLGRFREIVSDPLNLLIRRHPLAGTVEDGFVHLHNGNMVTLTGQHSYYGDFSNILVINRGVHEPLEEYVFQELLHTLPPAPSMLELGAYWGHYSMWLQKKRPNASVYLVEPDEGNILAGQYNFQQNQIEGEFIQAFVGQGQFEVDAFMRTRKLSHLDILHSDIQGFEIEMLDGSTSTLDNKLVDYIFVSTHSQELHETVIGKLTLHGYRVEVTSDFDAETTSYDGLIFASSPSVGALFEGFKPFGREQLFDIQPDQIVQGLTTILNASKRQQT